MKASNAIELLEEQHEETLELLERLEKSGVNAARRSGFRKLQASLLAHMAIEEEIFYPAVVAASEGEGEPLAEGYEEHSGARAALSRCARTAVLFVTLEHSGARAALSRCARSLGQEKLFQVRIGVLTELIKHHVKEERSSILPRARKSLSRDELSELGAQMQARFKAALANHRIASDLDRKSTTRAQRALAA